MVLFIGHSPLFLLAFQIFRSWGPLPQDLKIWNSRRKRGDCLINKTTNNFFIKTENNCKSYIVTDKLSFYKMWLVTYSIFQLQYHRSIPWVNEYHGWMSLTIPWVNSMGGWITWVDEYHGLMSFSIQIIPPSLRSNGPHYVKFPPAKPLLNMNSHWREGFYVVNP